MRNCTGAGGGASFVEQVGSWRERRPEHCPALSGKVGEISPFRSTNRKIGQN